MEISSEYVQLSVNDGTTMRAWVARPKEEGANPGLLVFQEAFGVNAHIRDIAGRFAREGFVAVAPELFHRTGAGVEVRYDDFPSAVPHMKALNDASMAADQRAAFDWLRGYIGGDLPIFAIGYCMGGRAAFLAAHHFAARRSDFLLRRWNCAERDKSRLARPRERLASSAPVLLGRTRQAHSAGAGPRGERCAARGRKKLRQRRDFQRRPRILLRRARQL